MNSSLINVFVKLCALFSVLGNMTFNDGVITNYINEKEEPIMTLSIPSIGVKNNIYSKDSSYNDIDKNVIIMNESSFPSDDLGNVILGAHSGTGPVAYFKNFDKLKIDDEVYLEYDNVSYLYKIKKIYDDLKDGKIRINMNSKDTLTLYTCKPHDKNNYLVVVAYKVK